MRSAAAWLWGNDPEMQRSQEEPLHLALAVAVVATRWTSSVFVAGSAAGDEGDIDLDAPAPSAIPGGGAEGREATSTSTH